MTCGVCGLCLLCLCVVVGCGGGGDCGVRERPDQAARQRGDGQGAGHVLLQDTTLQQGTGTSTEHSLSYTDVGQGQGYITMVANEGLIVLCIYSLYSR